MLFCDNSAEMYRIFSIFEASRRGCGYYIEKSRQIYGSVVLELDDNIAWLAKSQT